VKSKEVIYGEAVPLHSRVSGCAP